MSYRSRHLRYGWRKARRRSRIVRGLVRLLGSPERLAMAHQIAQEYEQHIIETNRV